MSDPMGDVELRIGCAPMTGNVAHICCADCRYSEQRVTGRGVDGEPTDWVLVCAKPRVVSAWHSCGEWKAREAE